LKKKKKNKKEKNKKFFSFGCEPPNFIKKKNTKKGSDVTATAKTTEPP